MKKLFKIWFEYFVVVLVVLVGTVLFLGCCGGFLYISIFLPSEIWGFPWWATIFWNIILIPTLCMIGDKVGNVIESLLY